MPLTEIVTVILACGDDGKPDPRYAICRSLR